METASEYTFPIFISSTDYNLKDFRAELARFLKELGYRPILSSAEGFPDSSPNLEPWESCIPVLDSCFVMILAIDGKYGTGLSWPNFPELFKELSISPTHGEYHFAHKKAMRMLVFIRKEVMTYYQSYRQAYKTCNKDEDAVKETLKKTLPEYIDYETLKFVHQVKTTKPIPWIKEFDDITDVKKEVQKKMLNELAEIFLIKNKHLQTVIDSFNKALDTVSPEEQKNILTKINATKPFVEAVEKSQSLTKELEETKSLLEKVKGENSVDKKKYETRIKELKTELKELEKTSGQSSFDRLYLKDGKVQFGNPNFLETGSLLSGTSINLDSSSPFVYTTQPQSSPLFLRQCDECKKIGTTLGIGSLGSPYLVNDFNECPSCHRYFCKVCWPKGSAFTANGIITDKVCPKCNKEEKE